MRIAPPLPSTSHPSHHINDRGTHGSLERARAHQPQGKSLKVYVPGEGVLGRLCSSGIAALQGFPAPAAYAPPSAVCETRALRMFADAVPPPLGEAILEASFEALVKGVTTTSAVS